MDIRDNLKDKLRDILEFTDELYYLIIYDSDVDIIADYGDKFDSLEKKLKVFWKLKEELKKKS